MIKKLVAELSVSYILCFFALKSVKQLSNEPKSISNNSASIFYSFIGSVWWKKTNQETIVKERAFQQKTDTIEMQSSFSSGNVLFKGNEYRYEIERMPSDSLPMIKDESGNVFVDNCVRLTITRKGNQSLISKVFTKKTFMNDVPSKFMKEAILEGFVFYEERTSDADGIVFAASVCIPQTDLFYPLIVRVSLDGGIRVEPDNIMMELMETPVE